MAVVLMGTFDADFLAIRPGDPRTIRQQKCFVLRDAATGKLANRCILVSNIRRRRRRRSPPAMPRGAGAAPTPNSSGLEGGWRRGKPSIVFTKSSAPRASGWRLR
jgi:hypothetical protein